MQLFQSIDGHLQRLETDFRILSLFGLKTYETSLILKTCSLEWLTTHYHNSLKASLWFTTTISPQCKSSHLNQCSVHVSSVPKPNKLPCCYCLHSQGSPSVINIRHFATSAGLCQNVVSIYISANPYTQTRISAMSMLFHLGRA